MEAIIGGIKPVGFLRSFFCTSGGYSRALPHQNGISQETISKLFTNLK
jgi:hypothetical protein